jgi:hypothetical protein
MSPVKRGTTITSEEKMNPYIQELAKQLATKINEKVNLPFLNEEQEQAFFELVVMTLLEMTLGRLLTFLEPQKKEKAEGKK